jgi:hypothetical protein
LSWRRREERTNCVFGYRLGAQTEMAEFAVSELTEDQIEEFKEAFQLFGIFSFFSCTTKIANVL